MEDRIRRLEVGAWTQIHARNPAADDELEDILAGLMAAGVRPDEIELREFRATGAREVAVRGEVKYRIEGPMQR